MESLRKCNKCGLEAFSDSDLDLFSAHSQSKYGRQNLCKVCMAKQQREKPSSSNEYRREWHRKKRAESSDYNDKSYFSRAKKTYGITKKEYLIMYEDQQGNCKICGKNESEQKQRLHIDHCHAAGIVRGLLCSKCNTALGLMDDDIDRLEIAKQYLALTATEVALL